MCALLLTTSPIMWCRLFLCVCDAIIASRI